MANGTWKGGGFLRSIAQDGSSAWVDCQIEQHQSIKKSKACCSKHVWAVDRPRRAVRVCRTCFTLILPGGCDVAPPTRTEKAVDGPPGKAARQKRFSPVSAADRGLYQAGSRDVRTEILHHRGLARRQRTHERRHASAWA